MCGFPQLNTPHECGVRLTGVVATAPQLTQCRVTGAFYVRIGAGRRDALCLLKCTYQQWARHSHMIGETEQILVARVLEHCAPITQCLFEHVVVIKVRAMHDATASFDNRASEWRRALG